MRPLLPVALTLAVFGAALFLVAKPYLNKSLLERSVSSAGAMARSGQSPVLKVRANSFLLSNFRNRDTAELLVHLHSFGFGDSYHAGPHGQHGPFFFSSDGRALLSQTAVHAITELPSGMTWIGDETIIVMMVSGQYSKVITSRGILYGGWSKNCHFASIVLHMQLKCENWDLLSGEAFGFPLLLKVMGEADLLKFMRSNAIDAIIAGPRTYHDTKQILVHSPAIRDCLDAEIDIESVLVLLNKRCRRT